MVIRATPRLSIGLPVYNGEDYLTESPEALLGRAYEDFELIISDNTVTDGTPDICRRYAKQETRIGYFRQPRNLLKCRIDVLGRSLHFMIESGLHGLFYRHRANRLRYPAGRLYAEYIWGYMSAQAGLVFWVIVAAPSGLVCESCKASDEGFVAGDHDPGEALLVSFPSGNEHEVG
jgi:Glycosyl transferase family 2